MTRDKILFSFMMLITLLYQSVFAGSLAHSTTAYTIVGSGTPLVLIHAFPTDKSLWKPQLEQLQNNFKVIAIDLKGFGGSSSVHHREVTMTEYAKEVKDLLEYLKIKKAIIGGESMGGYVTLAFLKKYPTYVQGIILAGTEAIGTTKESQAKYETMAQDVLKNGTQGLINSFIDKAISKNASAKTRDYLKHIFAAQSATGMAAALRGMAVRENTSNVLAQTKVPVLIITGADDAVIPPQQSYNMHKIAKQSKLVVIKNTGHLASLENPQPWNQAVIDTFSISQ